MGKDKERFHRLLMSLLATIVVLSLMGASQGSEALEIDDVFKPAGTVKGKLERRRKKVERMREAAKKDWQYGGYLDVGYLPNLSSPDADEWRSKTTSFKLNSPKVNLAMGYFRKEVNPEGSRWGGEFAVQTGVDSEGLVSKTSPDTIGSADTLRHFSRANLSYLFPAGNGLKITGGLMNSYIGYSSFHSKDNVNYTRGYILDNVPYFLFGAEALYPVTDTLTIGGYVVSGFTYLTEPNEVPSFGLQTVWETTPTLTVVQNLYYGPDQRNTDLRHWRFFSDSIVEWKTDTWAVAAAYDIGTEEQAVNPENPRYMWMSGAIWASRNLPGPWWVGFRPEFYWDPDGVITGAEQLIWAVTGTIAYRIRVLSKNTLTAKLEYRFDRSTGSGGGFFTGQPLSTGIPQLTPNQQLLILGLMWAFDS
ncbi:MAG: porin [Nitrospirota bacterium]|nr:MAG: porin [Nitrospirota bacterium]